jgi:hypothetical protein
LGHPLSPGQRPCVLKNEFRQQRPSNGTWKPQGREKIDFMVDGFSRVETNTRCAPWRPDGEIQAADGTLVKRENSKLAILVMISNSHGRGTGCSASRCPPDARSYVCLFFGERPLGSCRRMSGNLDGPALLGARASSVSHPVSGGVVSARHNSPSEADSGFPEWPRLVLSQKK